MKLMNMMSVSMLLLLGCSKGTPDSGVDVPTKPDETPKPIPEVIIEKDITNKAVVVPSIENTNGQNSAEGSSKLTDNKIDTKFLIQNYTNSFYVEFRLDSARMISAYSITSGNDSDGRDPRDWTITASNDGVNWELIDSQMAELFRNRNVEKRYDFKNSKKFKYVRWNVKNIYYGSMFQVAEFRLFQVPQNKQKVHPVTFIDSTSRNGYSLVFVNKSITKTLLYQEKFVETYFTNYPKLINDFNPNTKKRLVFIVDPAYDGAAYAISDIVVYSYDYMNRSQNDTDIVTHEIMHHVQGYSSGAAPGWLVEGIADYARYKYGLNNAAAGWKLPDFSSSHKYTDAYRVTARFLAWIEAKVKSGFVKNVDEAIRNKTYSPNFWADQTGKNVDDLWQQYAANPAL